MVAEADRDIWSDWLRHGRHGGDAAYLPVVQARVAGFADKVVGGARLAPGMVLLDVGCGDGLVALAAIARVGPQLRVIGADLSGPLLRHAARAAEAKGVQGQCRFVQACAERLEGIADASVDAVTARSVLAYVADKKAALAAFYRVLKPGGRLSIAEPSFRDQALEACALRQLVEAQGADAAWLLRLLHRWKAAQFPDSEAAMRCDPLTDYDERDLLRLAQAQGFCPVHVELHLDHEPARALSWNAFLHRTPHPGAPALAEIMRETFSAEEQALLEAALRPQLAAGRHGVTSRMIYLTALKPEAG